LPEEIPAAVTEATPEATLEVEIPPATVE